MDKSKSISPPPHLLQKFWAIKTQTEHNHTTTRTYQVQYFPVRWHSRTQLERPSGETGWCPHVSPYPAPPHSGTLYQSSPLYQLKHQSLVMINFILLLQNSKHFWFKGKKEKAFNSNSNSYTVIDFILMVEFFKGQKERKDLQQQYYSIF